MKRCNYFRFSDHRIIDMLFCPNFLVGVLKILRIHSKNSQNVGLFSSSSMRRTCAASLLDFPIFSSGSVKPVEPGLAPVQCSSSSRVALTQIWRHGVSCVAPRLRCSSTNLLRSTSVPRQVPNHSVAFQLFSVKSAFSIMKKFVGVRIFFKKSSILLGENEDW